MSYRTLYADIPWRFQFHYGKGRLPYPTISTAQACAMGDQIASMTAEHAHLYLWSTHVHLPDALDVMKAWDFRYIQVIPWDKLRMGLGHYFRHRTELLLFGVRGSLRIPRRDLLALIRERSSRHSQKPEKAYELIEAASPGPRLELFARRKRPGWDAWGNEVQSNIKLVVPQIADLQRKVQ